MIQKRLFLFQLKKLDKLYEDALYGRDIELPKYYSRLAVLELGSWIEECMDELVFYYTLRGRKRLRERANIQYLENLVKNNYGFHYNSNFRRMLKQTIGLVVLERIEKKMDSNLRQGLESALTQTRLERNQHAHKPIHISPKFTSPSVCLSLFNNIYNGLEEYEKQFKKLTRN